MAEQRAQRRLAAILASDVVGYSRLMELDEAGTLAALKSRRRDVLLPLVARHQGRTFKFTGDGVLIEVAASFDELQRIATSTTNALRLWDMNAGLDVTELARQIRVPTLVLHCKGDRVAPVEEGRLMARVIPGASFVELPGTNHAVLQGTPAFDLFFNEAINFLAMHNR